LRAIDHTRAEGHLAAWKALNASVAADLHDKRGLIKGVKWLHAYRASSIHTLSQRAAEALASVSPFRKRA
jgi:hypothetical protein